MDGNTKVRLLEALFGDDSVPVTGWDDFYRKYTWEGSPWELLRTYGIKAFWNRYSRRTLGVMGVLLSGLILLLGTASIISLLVRLLEKLK